MSLLLTFNQSTKKKKKTPQNKTQNMFILILLLAAYMAKGHLYITILVRATADLTSRIELTSGYKIHQSLLNSCTRSDRVNSRKCHLEFVAIKRP